MDFLEPGKRSAPYQLRALTMIARAADSGLEQPQRALLDATQRLLLLTDLDVATLEEVSPEDLAAEVLDPAQARQLIRLMVMLSLVDGPPSEDQMTMLTRFAAALGVDEPAVEVVRHLARGNRLRFRLAFMRRSHVRAYLRNTYRMLGGLRPLLRALLVARGVLPEDQQAAARYHAWEKLPVDSLGHRFFHHCTDAGLPLPGEKGGFPAGAIFHDFAHVLAGYDTSPEGEMKAAAIQAGFTHGDHDFFTALFGIVIHTAGVNLAPFPMPVLLGRIGQEGLAVEVLHALQRGAAMKVDLGADWNFWDYVELPIAVARERLGVPPVEATIAG